MITRKQTLWLTSAALAALAASTANAQDAPQGGACAAAQQAVTAIGEKYKPAFDEIEDEGDALKSDAEFSGKVDWEDTRIVFDLPQVTINDQRIVFGAPQVTMRLNTIVFHTPSVRMVRKKTGEYPEFTCHGFSCTVRWSPIYTDVPETFMERQEIKTEIPEFRWDNAEVVIGVPEFTMVRNEIVLGLPRFTLTHVMLNADKLQDKGQALKTKADALAAEQNEAVGNAVHGLYDCQRNEILRQRGVTNGQFDNAVKQVQASMAELAARGVDTSAVRQSDGTVTDMNKVIADILKKQQEANARFDRILEDLTKNEKKSVNKAVTA